MAETAVLTKLLAAAGAIVIILVRKIEKANGNLAGIANVELEEIDLTAHTSIDRFEEKFLTLGRPLHLLLILQALCLFLYAGMIVK